MSKNEQHPSITAVTNLLKQLDITFGNDNLHLADDGKVIVTGLKPGQP